jgi:hypothetical protein
MNGQSQAAIIATSLCTIGIYILDAYVLPKPLPDPVGAAIVALVCSLVVVFTPHTANPAGKLLRLSGLHRRTK